MNGRAHKEPTPESEKVTVNLTPPAIVALNEIMRLTGDSKTRAIDQALRRFAYLLSIVEAKGEIRVKETPVDELTKVRFF
jgi:hypothetical protein